MKNLAICLMLAAFLLQVAACSSTQSMLSVEKKMDSARHWDLLANQVAQKINRELVRKKMFTTLVYVRNSCGTPQKCAASPTYAFDEGFHDLLTSQLVNFGIYTSSTPEEANLVLEYKVQTVYHPPEQSNWNSFADDGHFEIIISSSIIERSRYFFLCTNIFTIPFREYWQYGIPMPASEVKLAGPLRAPVSVPASKQGLSR